MRVDAVRVWVLVLLAGCQVQETSVPSTTGPDRRDVTRPGVRPPMYRASSDGPLIAITSNAYGSFTDAPKAPQLGDTLADFELPNARGGTYALRDARAKGPVIVVFYRGFW